MSFQKMSHLHFYILEFYFYFSSYFYPHTFLITKLLLNAERETTTEIGTLTAFLLTFLLTKLRFCRLLAHYSPSVARRDIVISVLY